MRRKQQGKRAGSVFAAFVLALSSPLTAAAASPQFAYDEATWARLQDNVMEYDELELLVQEYNPTYLNNQATYQDGRESRNASEVREKQYEGAYDIYDSAENLRDQADDLEDLLSVPGMASAYASLMSAAVLTETTALQTEQSADASYRDSEMDRLDYMRQQDAVIAQVQSLFASYNQVKKTEPLLEKSLELQELSHQATEASRALGLATQIDVLQSLQSLESLRASVTETQASLQSLKQQLCVMTGWDYNASPEIADLPRADENRIALMNLEADTQTALAENLALKSNQRAFENMSEGSADKKNMERTIANQQETIRAGMNNLYQDILQKQTALRSAEAALASEQQMLNAVNLQAELGSATRLEQLGEEVSYLSCQIDVETANMNLQQAIETYDWTLRGYMN